MTELLTRRYELRDLLGEGGMGRVWRAWDHSLQREVALKCALNSQGPADSFRQEYWWMTRLSHPNLIEVFDFGADESGTPFYTMELVQGEALDRLLPLPLEEVARLVKQLGGALRSIHLEGLVHADIKADNIRRDQAGTYRLFDFGLMTPSGQAAHGQGTLAYMAPEVIQQARLDQRADLYSLGVLIFQALTGRLPFEAESPHALLRAHLEESPPLPSKFNAEVSGFWDRLVHRLLAKDPARRVQSAAELLLALGEHLEPDPPVLLCAPFVGREEEIRVLSAALDQLRDHATGGAHGVSGPVGSGRSRFLAEMSVRAQLRSISCFSTRVVANQAAYQPWADLLRQAWEALQSHAPAMIERHGPSLKALLPDLVHQADPAPLEPHQAKIRLHSAFTDLLLALVQQQPTLFLFDDWHLASPLAQEALRTVQRQLNGTRALFIFTWAAEEGPSDASTSAPLTMQALAPLRPREAARMMAAMFGQAQIPQPLINQVMELSDGLPQAIENLLAHWVTTGALSHVEGQWVLEPVAPERLFQNSDELLAARLQGLSDAARRTLELMAVWDAPIELDALHQSLNGLTDEVFFEALRSLELQRLIAVSAQGCVIEQQHLARALLYQLAPDRLQGLHAQVAMVLESQHPDLIALAVKTGPLGDSPQLSWTAEAGEGCIHLARHYHGAGRPNKAVPFMCAATHYLISLHASDAARQMAEQGLSLARTAGGESLLWEGGSQSQWGAVFAVLLGDSHRVGGELEAAQTQYEGALECLSAAETPWYFVHARIGLGLLQQVRGLYAEARDHLRDTLPAARGLAHGREELRCLAAMGRCSYQLGDLARTRAVYEDGLIRAQAAGDQVYLGDFLGNLGFLDITDPVPGEPQSVEQGLARLTEAIELQTAIGDKLGLNDNYMLFGNALYVLGELPRAEYAFLKNQGLCQEMGFYEEDVAWVNLAMVALDRGQFQQSCEHAQRATRLTDRTGNRFVRDLATGFEARAWLGLGQWKRASEALALTLQSQREAEDTYGELYSLMGALDLSMFLGDFDAAETALLAALDLQARLGSNDFVLPLQLAGVRLAIVREQWTVAETQCRESLIRAESRQSQFWEATACLLMGQISAATGQESALDAWLTRADALARRCEAQTLQIAIHFERALQAERQQNILAADAHLVKAQDIAVSIDTPDWQARCAFTRARLHFPSPRAAGWLREAYDHLKPLLGDLTNQQRAEFFRLPDRAAIAERSLGGVSSASTGTDSTVARHIVLDTPSSKEAVHPQNQWFDELQRTVERLQKQLDFAQTVQGIADEDHILRLALQLFSDVSRLPRVDILMMDGVRLVSRATLATSDSAPQEDWSFYAEVVVPAAQSGELAYVPNLDTDAGVGVGEPRALLVLPLGDESARWGALFAAGHPTPGDQLAPWDIEALRVLGDQLLSALRRAKLESEWQAKTNRLEMLYTLSSKVTSTLVMAEVLDLVLKFSLEITQAERGIIFLVGENGELQGEAARVGEAAVDALATSESVSRSILRKVLDTREALCVADAHDDDMFRHQKSIQDLNLRTVMAVPLAIHKRPLGVLYVDSRVVVNAFTDRDLELLRAIASHASVALENARLYDLATVDRLTKLYFRSYFEQRMHEDLARAIRTGTEVSLLMMDIDHFKKFNDTYGHAVGDRVLAHVASLIRNNVRHDIDVPCRYGGEEMVVLLPDTSAEGGAVFAERLRRAIDETPLHTAEHGPLHVTISIGAASCPKDATTGLQLMELADQALYQSKRNGRNRVTSWVPGVVS